MFRRKTPESGIDMLNKFSVVENKLDILTSKFEAIKNLDGCCDCKEREGNIYEMLVAYFETKFSDFEIRTQLTEKEASLASSSCAMKDDFDTFKKDVLMELRNMCNTSLESSSHLKDKLHRLEPMWS